jgi:CRP/FNR family transcriptional regulator, anaerobic regulatory protein
VKPRDQANELLKASINRYVKLSDEECAALSNLFYPRRLDKREHWIQQGEYFTEIGFVVKGCFRTYYLHKDQERTSQFFLEGSWYTDYESWLTKQPTSISIEAIEPTELLLLPFHALERLYEQNPRYERVGRVMAENTIIKIRNRNLSLLNDTPEERYLKLIKERPKVIERVPQHLIASFLGIEPETLSRIRKKIMVASR